MSQAPLLPQCNAGGLPGACPFGVCKAFAARPRDSFVAEAFPLVVTALDVTLDRRFMHGPKAEGEVQQGLGVTHDKLQEENPEKGRE